MKPLPFFFYRPPSDHLLNKKKKPFTIRFFSCFFSFLQRVNDTLRGEAEADLTQTQQEKNAKSIRGERLRVRLGRALKYRAIATPENDGKTRICIREGWRRRRQEGRKHEPRRVSKKNGCVHADPPREGASASVGAKITAPLLYQSVFFSPFVSSPFLSFPPFLPFGGAKPQLLLLFTHLSAVPNRPCRAVR